MASNTKRLVPWISMEEWKQVYKQVYSKKREDKWAGLNQMIVWKSRVAKLSLGIECSLYLLQAILRDEEYKFDANHALSENDIALMYSTAIIRFINLISHLGQVDLRHQPISAIAEMAGIPDWVVSIRHEATHAKMPSLDILRPGANLAMGWLKENYWRTEEENSYDLYWPESNSATSRMMRTKTKEAKEEEETGSAAKCAVVSKELQQAVSMLVLLLKEMASRNSINEIQSPELHQYLYKLWLQTKNFATPLNKKEIANLTVPLKKLQPLVFDDIKRLLSELVESDGEEEMEHDAEKDAAFQGKCFVSALCQSPHLLTKPGKGTIFSSLKPIWSWIQEWKLIPHLMNSLVHIEIADNNIRKAQLGLISALANAILQAQNHPQYAKNIFKFDESWRSTNWEKMTLPILQDPVPDTWSTVSKLFQLHNPPVDATKQEKVAALLHLYLDGNMSAEPSRRAGFGKSTMHSKIYTVEMLNPLKEKPLEQEDSRDRCLQVDVSSLDPAPVIDVWTLCSEHDWSRIPFGSLPKNRIDELEFKGVEWEFVDAEWDDCDSDRLTNGTKRTGERFDWNSLMRKRRRRGGLTKEGPAGQSVAATR
ncbi:hypothetical protein GHT06_014972 [Daphnia sinensis]|uniref:Ribosomal biogenesis protein LAS1L n=1 Tax=Daphnia sinensis TaxID=1820382 RepID=A0AAD5KRS5_9CRUS|nr:hypothetical protein GHT06_014972 [Daphnia sinensis]